MRTNNSKNINHKVALVTGSARRVGAEISRQLHAAGMNINIHCNHSKEEALSLAEALNTIRTNSAHVLYGDLLDHGDILQIVDESTKPWGRIDLLVNNASTYYPTPVGEITPTMWDDLVGTNLKAPLFLSQAAAPWLKESHGNIINIVDIHAERPLKTYTTYCAAKAGLAMLTKCLAMELGPNIRVNGIAPGSIIWPEGKSSLSEAMKTQIIEKTALGRMGAPEDIAKMVVHLANDADYITGQIIAVDGGLSLP